MKSKNEPESEHEQHIHEHLPKGYFLTWAVALVLSAVVGYLNLHFENRVLPNVFVGSAPVSDLKKDEVRTVVADQVAQVQLTFKDGDTVLNVPAAEVGVAFDIDVTVQAVMKARRSTNIATNLSLSTTVVPLAYTNDPGMLKAYIVAHFPKTYVDPQDAQVVFNAASQQFDVAPGVPGKGFDIKAFQGSLPDIAAKPRTVVLPVTSVPVEPLINDAAAAKAQQEANNLLKVPLSFVHDGQTAYEATAADIASWLHFNPDTIAGTLAVEVDEAKVQQFVADTVGGKVTTLPVDRKVVIDKATGEQHVVQQGSKGNQIEESDKVAQDIMTALSRHEALTRTLTVSEAPFKTVTITGTGKWIEVDLSQQTVTIYLDNEPIRSFLISSGKAATPTAIGEGRVYAKYPLQTMTGTINGEYYYVPNIKWVSYFYGGEAFHGTYWHHNFGHPMSHGCINMTEDDAKILYDFAPIGTKVIVHA